MKKKARYWIGCLLLASYAIVTLAGQFEAFGKLLNSGSDTSISTETANSRPFDGRPILTQWKHIGTSVNSETSFESINLQCFVFHSEQNEIVSLPQTYTSILSHFPYPPFWPRDPSLS
jgi:hypothetical protein